MRRIFDIRLRFLIITVICSVLGSVCSEDEPTQSSSPVCFSVGGFNVTVNNMWKSGGSYTTNVQGLSSFTETVSQNSETHTLEWTNIQNNYTTYTVDSFNVKIDGKNYSYPANKCQ